MGAHIDDLIHHGAPDMPVGILECRLRLPGIQAREHHHDGRLHSASRICKYRNRLFVRATGRLHDNVLRARPQLLVRLLDVYHQVLIRLADPHHSRRRDHVQNQLLHRARLESGGARKYFWTRHRLDCEVGLAPDLGVPVAGDCNGLASELARIPKPPDDVGGATARSQTDYDVSRL